MLPILCTHSITFSIKCAREQHCNVLDHFTRLRSNEGIYFREINFKFRIPASFRTVPDHYSSL